MREIDPGEGSPKLVSETVPGRQEDEEYSVLQKFIASLRHFEGRDISGPWRRGDGWPDFELGKEERSLGIEIVEVRHTGHDEWRRRRERYAERARRLVEDLAPRLFGIEIRLHDGYQAPPYPDLNTREGARVAEAIAEHIRSLVPRLEGLPERHMLRADAQDTPGNVEISVVAFRFADSASRIPPVICFPGAFPEPEDALERLLSDAIERKLRRQYGSYAGRLVLPVYGREAWFAGPPPSEAGAMARRLAAERPHPFDEIWFIFPYPGIELGSIEQVWP